MKKVIEYVKEETLKSKKELYHDYSKIVNIIRKYIIDNKIIVFGGFALNEYLDGNSKIYAKYDLPDIDCYSSNAINHVIKLANILYKAGFVYVKIMAAQHPNSYRLSVNFKNMFDITNIDKSLYNKFISAYKIEKIERRVKSKFTMVTIDYIKSDFYKELSRPVSSLFRWEKIVKRMEIINKHFKLQKTGQSYFTNVNKKGILNEKILEYVKERKYPLTDCIAAMYHMNMPCKTMVSIMSVDPDKTILEVKELIKGDEGMLKIKRTFTSFDRIPPRTFISLNNQTILEIFDASKMCISVNNIRGFQVCAAFFVLSMFYLDTITLKDKDVVQTVTNNICIFEKWTKQNKIQPKRLMNTKCYGIEVPRSIKLREAWDNEPDIIYKSGKKLVG